MNGIPGSEWLTTWQAADLLPVTDRYVRGLCKAGMIGEKHGPKCYYIRRSQLDKFIEVTKPADGKSHLNLSAWMDYLEKQAEAAHHGR